MDDHEVGEDAISLEALQAQIDLSMSFAQNMVSSWVKPSRKLRSRPNKDTEAELAEYMRRPPRLGVGAPIPETGKLSRETARLRGQLNGKSNKRSREDDDYEKKEKSDDDEEESRSGAIKKKTRVDPFGERSGKKKNKKNEETPKPASPDPPDPTEAEAAEQAEVISMVTILSAETRDSSASPPTPNRKKHKKYKNSAAPPLKAESASEGSLPISPSSRNLEKGTPGPAVSPKAPGAILSSPPSLSHYSSRPGPVTPTALLKGPLLNLSPPGNNSDDSGDAKPDTPGNGPKKKRKRRKKKKKLVDSVEDPPGLSR